MRSHTQAAKYRKKARQPAVYTCHTAVPCQEKDWLERYHRKKTNRLERNFHG